MNREPLREVVDYYTHFAEESRLTVGSSQLEFERTKEMLGRFIPAQAADIVDVGGAAGAYAFWLSGLGHRVHLVDATPRLIDEGWKDPALRNGILTVARLLEEQPSIVGASAHLLAAGFRRI